MRVLQYYYTSCNNEETGFVGFQVKAMSPGISPELQTQIERLIAYRIPYTLDSQAIALHPIALRYYYRGPDECILLCSQSIGSDMNGRPGNFFAHVVVLEPDLFPILPPILYWKSPFWRKQDTEPRPQSSVLPVLSSFDAEPLLDADDIWSFLAQGNRRSMLYKLLCAVIHSNKTLRRIVIFDTNDNVAWWITSVSCLLPPDYRPLLTFATYHHEPQQGQYLITGTTSDSSLRPTPENYQAYFILNAETGTTSEVEDSAYAQLAAATAQLDLYETQLLALFSDYAKRFPKPTVIDEQLDLLALYAKLHAPRDEATLSSQELQALNLALSALEQLRDYAEEDLEELQRLQQVVAEAGQRQQNAALSRAYERITVLLKKHIVQSDEDIEATLKAFTEKLATWNAQEQAAQYSQLHQTYSEEVLTRIINRPTYLQWLTTLLEQGPSLQIQLIWHYLGTYIQPGGQGQVLLVISLRVVGRLLSEQRMTEHNALLAAMLQAMQGREQEWLLLATQSRAELPDNILDYFYYSFVYPLDLDQRVPYRNIVARAAPHLLKYEIRGDLHNAYAAQRLPLLEKWIRHAQQKQYDTEPLIMAGISMINKSSSPQDWHELTPKLLTNSLFAPLPKKLEDALLQEVFSSISLSSFSMSDIELYKRYQQHPALSEGTRTTLASILAIASGQMDAALAQQLYQQVKLLLPEEYQQIIKQAIPEFFQYEVTDEAHRCLINALFTRNHGYATYFWQIYLETFEALFTYPPTLSNAARMLAFWFNVSPSQLQQPYIIQECLLKLPLALDDVQKNHSFQDIARTFNAMAYRQAWFPAVQNFFVEKKNILGALGQGLVARFQKKEMGRDAGALEAQLFEAEISNLFDKKHSLSQHRNLAKLYNREQREQFWASYWKNFIQALASREVDLVLTLLSFWFDEAFETLDQRLYLPQQFFLGLAEALEKASKERGFRDAARQLNVRALQQEQDRCHWYPLIKNSFLA